MQAGTVALLACACPRTHPALWLSSTQTAGALWLLYSRGRGSGTGGTSSESSGHTPPGSPPACSCKSNTSLASAPPSALAQGAWPQQPHRLPGGRKISGAQLAPTRAKCEAPNPLLSVFATKLTHFTHSVVTTRGQLELQTGSSSSSSQGAGQGAQPKSAYPDSNPGRGSLKVVVRVLWSTK